MVAGPFSQTKGSGKSRHRCWCPLWLLRLLLFRRHLFGCPFLKGTFGRFERTSPPPPGKGDPTPAAGSIQDAAGGSRCLASRSLRSDLPASEAPRTGRCSRRGLEKRTDRPARKGPPLFLKSNRGPLRLSPGETQTGPGQAISSRGL